MAEKQTAEVQKGTFAVKVCMCPTLSPTSTRVTHVHTLQTRKYSEGRQSVAQP